MTNKYTPENYYNYSLSPILQLWLASICKKTERISIVYVLLSLLSIKRQREKIYTQKKITITQLSSHNLGPFEQNPDRQRFTDCKILNLLRNHLMPLISGAGEVLRPSVWNFHVIAYSVTSLCYVTLPADLVETYIVLGRLYRD